MRFSRELEQLAGDEQLALKLGLLALELLVRSVTLVAPRLAPWHLRLEARIAVRS